MNAEVIPYDIVELESQCTAVVKGRVPIADLPAFFRRAYGVLFDVLGRMGVEPASEPFARYRSEPGDDAVDVEAGVVVAEEVECVGEVGPSSLPACRAATTIHVGPYDQLERTYTRVVADLARHGRALHPTGMWEFYLTDPEAEPDPATWRTRVVFPLAE